MFEKEAKEYTERALGAMYLSAIVAKDKLHAYKIGQYDGYIQGAKYGYNKANEWHYPSKGELPDVMQEVMICLKDEKIITRAIRVNSDLWTSPTNDYFSREIIAWKEIVLPKESE